MGRMAPMPSPPWGRPRRDCRTIGSELASWECGLHLPAMNPAPRIDVDESPDPALRDAILKPLRAFNESQVGPVKAEHLAIALRGPDNAITGGLWGYSVV